MLETNERYMSQKELDTKVLYDTYYVYLIGSLLMTIQMASAGLKTDKRCGHEKPISFKMSFIADARETIDEIFYQGTASKEEPESS